MKKLIALYISGLLLLTSCESDPAPGPSPQPEAEIPGEAKLNLPQNNKECEQGEVTGNSALVEFSWEAAEAADKYDLNVTNLDTQEITSKTGITSTSAEMNLERANPYAWEIISRNNGTASTSSEKWKFYLAGDGQSNFAPFPVAAKYPSPGATVNPDNSRVTVEWEKSEDPNGDTVSYTLYADKIDGLQAPPAEYKNVTETSMQITVEPNTVYFWRVVSSDGNNAAASSIFTFKTTN